MKIENYQIYVNLPARIAFFLRYIHHIYRDNKQKHKSNIMLCDELTTVVKRWNIPVF